MPNGEAALLRRLASTLTERADRELAHRCKNAAVHRVRAALLHDLAADYHTQAIRVDAAHQAPRPAALLEETPDA